MSIQIRNITKNYGRFTAVNHFSLEIPNGELTALLGPSGSGKTTLLRIIAGLETPDCGSVYFHGEEVTGIPAGKRQAGFVFQHYALFRHLNVFENIAFGMRVKPRKTRLSESQIQERVNFLLQRVQLEGMADRFPSQLSGGQRQRVALARALAVEPKVLLLDEPFGALDAKVRKELRRWIRRLHEEIHLNTIFVTHDQEEALDVADRIVIMNEGRMEQSGTAQEVYDAPRNLFVYRFLGDINLLRSCKSNDQNAESPVYARPHELWLTREPEEANSVEAVITHIRFMGSLVKVQLDSVNSGDLLEVELTRAQYQAWLFQTGERVYVRSKNAACFQLIGSGG